MPKIQEKDTGPEKLASKPSPYVGQTRLQVVKSKIIDGKSFSMGNHGKDGIVFGMDGEVIVDKKILKNKKIKKKKILKIYGLFKNVREQTIEKEKWPWEMSFTITKNSKKVDGIIDIRKIFKDSDFGGGGSGGGAADTEVTESLQCYYTSALYNGTSADWKILKEGGPDKKILKKYIKNCDANVSLNDCIKAVSSKKTLASWIKETPNVFVKTAEAIQGHRFGKGFTSGVNFHRGSKFMKSIYARRKRCMDHDKYLTKNTKDRETIAPSSFSDDKWNPGDIWMSMLPKNAKHPFPDNKWEGKLGVDTCDWESLEKVVWRVAADKQTLGISLKKVMGTAHVTEFNPPARKQNKNVKYLGFTFGQTGNFFGSADIYIYFDAEGADGGKQAIQWRAFDSTKGWQGEIKGTHAAGGKIGGGGTNYYVEKYFKRSIGGGLDGHSWKEKTGNWPVTEAFNLYEKYNPKQLKKEIKGDIPANVSLPTFKNNAANYINNKGRNTPSAFKFGKYMGLLLIDSILGYSGRNRNSWATDTFRYAQSNIDISSFYIKVS